MAITQDELKVKYGYLKTDIANELCLTPLMRELRTDFTQMATTGSLEYQRAFLKHFLICMTPQRRKERAVDAMASWNLCFKEVKILLTRKTTETEYDNRIKENDFTNKYPAFYVTFPGRSLREEGYKFSIKLEPFMPSAHSPTYELSPSKMNEVISKAKTIGVENLDMIYKASQIL